MRLKEEASPLGLLSALGVWPLPLSGSVSVSDPLALSRAECCLSCVLQGQATVGAGWREAGWRGGGRLTAC